MSMGLGEFRTGAVTAYLEMREGNWFNTLQRANTAADMVERHYARRFGNVRQTLQQTSTAFAAIGAAAIVGIAGLTKLAAGYEQTEIAMTTMLKSADLAKVKLAELRDFAARTPFQFSQLTQVSRLMLAYKFQAQELIPVLTDVGDAVAGLGGEPERLQRVLIALGQIQAKGRVQAQEMLQLTENGIGAWDYLSKAMGKSTAEVMKLSEKGLIPAKFALDALRAGMRRDFGGMMAEQAKTTAGQFSNLVDQLEKVGTEIGTAFLPVANKMLKSVSGIAGAIDGWSDSEKENAASTAMWGAGIAIAVAAATGAAGVFMTWHQALSTGKLILQAHSDKLAGNTAAVLQHAGAVATSGREQMRAAIAQLRAAYAMREEMVATGQANAENIMFVESEIAKGNVMLRNAQIARAEAAELRAGATAGRAFFSSFLGMAIIVGAVTAAVWALNKALNAYSDRADKEISATETQIKNLENQKRAREQLAESLRGLNKQYTEAKSALDAATKAHKDATKPQAELNRIQGYLRESLHLASEQYDIQTGKVKDLGEAAVKTAEKLLNMERIQQQIAAANARKDLQTAGKEAGAQFQQKFTFEKSSLSYIPLNIIAWAMHDWNSAHPGKPIDYERATQGKAGPYAVMEFIRDNLTAEEFGYFLSDMYPKLQGFKMGGKYSKLPRGEREQFDKALALVGDAYIAVQQLQQAQRGIPSIPGSDEKPPYDPNAGTKPEPSVGEVLNKRLADIEQYAASEQQMGRPYDKMGAQIEAYETAYQSYIESPYVSSIDDPRVQRVIQQLTELRAKKANKDIVDTLNREIREAEEQANVAGQMGNPFDLVQARIDAFKRALDATLKLPDLTGMNDPRVTLLLEDLNRYQGVRDNYARTEKTNGIIGDFWSRLGMVKKNDFAFGDPFSESMDDKIAQAEIYRDTIVRLLETGLMPMDAQVQELVDTYLHLKAAIDEAAGAEQRAEDARRQQQANRAELLKQTALRAEATKLSETKVDDLILARQTTDALERQLQATQLLQALYPSLLGLETKRLETQNKLTEAKRAEQDLWTSTIYAPTKRTLSGVWGSIAGVFGTVKQGMGQFGAASEATKEQERQARAEAVSNFGEVLWNAGRDKSAASRYFREILSTAASHGWKRMWDNLTAAPTDAQGKVTGPAKLDKFLNGLGIGKMAKNLGLPNAKAALEAGGMLVDAYSSAQGGGAVMGGLSGAMAGLALGGPVGAAVGLAAGALFGDSEERKRAEDDARRQRAQMVQELQRANNKLDRVNDNLNNGILADIPNRMTFGGDAVAATIQREQLRGAR